MIFSIVMIVIAVVLTAVGAILAYRERENTETTFRRQFL